MSVADPYYCTRTPTPQNCVLWGVSWQRVALACASLVSICVARLFVASLFGFTIFIVKRVTSETYTNNGATPYVKQSFKTVANLAIGASSTLAQHIQRFLISITWHSVVWLRAGLVWLAFVFLVPIPTPNGFVMAVRKIIIFVFCVIWLFWTNVFMVGVQQLVVAEIERRSLRRMRANTTATMSSKSKLTMATDLSSKARAAGQIVNILRWFIIFVTVLISFQLLGVDLYGILTFTSVYFLALIMALIPLAKDTMAGLFALNNPMNLLPGDEMRGGALTMASKKHDDDMCTMSNNMLCSDVSLWRIAGTSQSNGHHMFVPSSNMFELGLAAVYYHDHSPKIWAHVEFLMLNGIPLPNQMLEMIVKSVTAELQGFHPDLMDGSVGIAFHVHGVGLQISFRVPQTASTIIPEFVMCVLDHLHRLDVGPLRVWYAPPSRHAFPELAFASTMYRFTPPRPRVHDGFALTVDEFCGLDELQVEGVVY